MDFETSKWLKQCATDCIFNLNNENQSQARFLWLRTGPRDDLESLCNLLLYLSNSYNVLDLAYPRCVKHNMEHKLCFLREYKKSYTLARTSDILLKAEHKMYRFCKEVDGLQYGQMPDYDKLRNILKSLINFEKN